ncbi:N-formylglutamate amidohydrolase [Paraburkholderia sp. UCT2]|uniref:N-formylglutamate amidohydrolase n=1 Tax=Paraburkholderia sp. UCT2 TaxID=2615208 RepID=UPI00165668C9|nr:N-formylglutamate amidohydrolase [Paraburkholderia sp. UCT2]
MLMLVVHARQWLRNAQEGVRLADCTVSTHFGRSADARLVQALTSQVQTSGYSWVLSPAGAGGFAARRYGNPGDGLHVIELEVGGRWRAGISSLAKPRHIAVA